MNKNLFRGSTKTRVDISSKLITTVLVTVH